MRPIITLTTDFGLKDPYQGAMKGAILSINPEVRFVDITHQVRPGNIVEGAFIFFEAYKYFPAGAIHIGVVDPGVGGSRRPVLVQTERFFFIGPDNGIFGLAVKNEKVKKIVHLKEARYFRQEVSNTFHGRDIFGPVAAHLSLGVNPASFGPEVVSAFDIAFPEPVEKDGAVTGEVVYVDSFGNLITNIEAVHLAAYKGVEVSIKGRVIKGLTRTYSAARTDAPIALIGSSGHLEVALNSESAANILGVDTGERVAVRELG